jgi:hypothetical protein
MVSVKPTSIPFFFKHLWTATRAKEPGGVVECEMMLAFDRL